MIGASMLLLALVLAVLSYSRWAKSPGRGLTKLSDSERDWLADKGAVRIAGRSAEPPFAFFDQGGTYRGYEVDLAESLGPVLGIGIEVIPMPPDEAALALANGEIDAIMGMVRDPESSDRYEFTEPYISSSLAVFVQSDRFDVARLEDLEGREVAVQAGTAAQKVLAENPGISSVVVRSVEEGLELLAGEEVVALLADELVGLRAAQLMGLGEDTKVVGLPTETVNYSIAVPKAADELLHAMNYALTSAQAVGLKQQVDGAWFGTSLGRTVGIEANSMITVGLGIVVVGLVLGNAIYLLLKARRRTGEYATSLQESQDKYEKLADGTSEAVFSVSGDRSLLEINNRMEALTGYRKDELLTMSLDDLVLPAKRQAVRDCLEGVLREGIGSLDDVSLLNRHGDPVPVQLSAHMVSEAGRRIIQCLARDVRERKRMRDQVERRSEDLSTINTIANMVSRLENLEEVLEKVLAKVLDLAEMGSGVIYLRGDRDDEMIPVVKQGLVPEAAATPDFAQGSRRLAVEVAQRGQILVSSASGQPEVPTASRMTGAGRGTLVGVPLRSKDRVHGVMNIHVREPRIFTDEDIALLTAVGNQIGVAIENAQLVHQLQRTVGDVSAMKRFNDSILQNMTNGLVVVDRGGKIRLVNRAGERMLGCGESDVIDESVEELLGSGAEIVRDSLERALVYSGEEVVVKRDGRESMPLGMSVSPLRDDAGKLNGVVVMLSDLREAKALEEERRRLDRLALLGEISAVMAHEIRNPLAGMGAGIQHLLTKFEEGDERREAMERILGESERVNRIIEDILLISRPPRLTLAPCDISEVIDDVISSWQEKAGAQGVEIRKYYASEQRMVRGDRMRLHQALSNLVLNGMEAMPDGGELSVAVTGPGGSELVGTREGGYLEVEISDTGVGIKEEEIGRIFEPFYSTKARGTGLGLAITRRIINEHGGEVEVESEEGEGTRFIVRLPLARRGG